MKSAFGTRTQSDSMPPFSPNAQPNPNVDGRCAPASQVDVRPARQLAQAPQLTAHGTTTTSPARKFSTPGPHFSTSATPSCP
jgi:hypothetical protein